MKYTVDIVIEVPLDICTKMFDTIENLKHWQRGFISVEHVSGTPGAFGSKMKTHYKVGKNQMALIETITHKNLPYEVHSTYNIDGLDDIQENYFGPTPENFTKWVSVNEFVPLNFKMRMMIWLMPKTFKKQTLQYMKDFKNFAEKGISVSHA
ncbi:SRPBCC family protein [Gelidibacter mesophilus]|uniref:SRPBCC family protein n=1 Tax=Gelidibacter mesophilus TaxID=169050 RepID=UPI00040DF252|nr:SRPBCC family protein [Gelidibacter mesophilus]